ncbi:PilZ domain-containing protein [Halobacteriovorax marinus]|uniref:PilZ domain-containing protein n=1 Tax=Halobacteriovorax marinus TaxID=97084 RepID=UPI0012FD7C1C|nr:PilZ domain-containing protein [Halobacteriovorax marinus]
MDYNIWRTVITKYYLVHRSNKVLKYCDIFEIVEFVEAEELNGQSYIFDLRVREWILVKDIKVLQDTNYQFKQAAKRDKPSFTPPHKLPAGEFTNQRDCDYEYLLAHMKKSAVAESSSFVEEESVSNILEVNLESERVQRAQLEKELSGLRYVNQDFEEIINSLRIENKSLNQELITIEKQHVDTLANMDAILENHKKENLALVSEQSNEIKRLQAFERENFQIIEKNKSLAYALKVEKEQREELKSLLNRRDEYSQRSTHSEQLLSKAMDYFLHGPSGGEKELLEKKIALLTKELKEQENFYNLKLQKLKRSHSEDIAEKENVHSKDLGDIDSISRQRDDFEYKYKNILDENAILIQKLEDLESIQKIHSQENSDSGEFKDKYIHLANKHKKLEKEFSTLEAKLLAQQDKKENRDDSATKYLKDELIVAREEINKLKNRVQDLLVKNEELNESSEESNSETLKHNQLISNLRSDNKQLIEKYHELKERTAKYKVAYNELSESYKKLKQEFKERNAKFSKMTAKTDAIIESLKAKVDGAKDNYSKKVQELEEVKDREATLMIKIEEFKKVEEENQIIQLNTSKEEEDEELNRLIGDAFEVSNECYWMIQRDGEEPSGPYNFSEVYHMKINGELDVGVKIKKGNDLYKAKADIFELSVPVSTHGSGENIRYFIKRSSMRVPFYEMITFEINGEEYKGYCTSLSVGGIFLELNKLDEDFAVDKKGRLLFSAGALDNPFQCVAQIKNISDSRPKGIGLMFVDLPEQAQEDISFYINNYLNKTKQAS